MENNLFIATPDFEGEQVTWFGEDNTIKTALDDLQESGEFYDYCASNNINDRDSVEVGVFRAIYKDDPKWDSETFDSDWKWALGDRVATKFIVYEE